MNEKPIRMKIIQALESEGQGVVLAGSEIYTWPEARQYGVEVVKVDANTIRILTRLANRPGLSTEVA
jgi:hypothetical protein